MEKAIAGLLVAIGVTIAIFSLAGGRLIERDKQAKPTDTRLPADPLPPPSPMAPAALKVLEGFCEGADLESKADFVRDTIRVRPMMVDYHEKRKHSFPTLGRVSPGKEIRLDDSPAVFFEVEPFRGSRYPVAVVWDGERFAVDWESLTAYGTMDWDDWLETKPTTVQTLRIYVQNATAAEKIPDAPAGLSQFRIAHRDGSEAIIALAHPKVAALFPPLADKKDVPVTIEVAWQPFGTGEVSFPEIVRVVSSTWSQ